MQRLFLKLYLKHVTSSLEPRFIRAFQEDQDFCGIVSRTGTEAKLWDFLINSLHSLIHCCVWPEQVLGRNRTTLDAAFEAYARDLPSGGR